MPHLLLHEPTIYNGHLQEPATLTPVGSGAVTPWFNDLGLSRPGIEPRSPACEANVLPLSHHGDGSLLCDTCCDMGLLFFRVYGPSLLTKIPFRCSFLVTRTNKITLFAWEKII